MKNNNGFTLLELIIVMLLISLILGISVVFFANTLPSSKFNATVREMSAAIRHAKNRAQTEGETQTITIDLDSKKYGIEGQAEKNIPADINIKVADPVSGEVTTGKRMLVFPAVGGAEGGPITLWNSKKKATINLDPIAGSIIIK